jgi:predicted HicB family RNase H-like nuclease
VLEYKGYTGRVEFDDQAGLLHGEVIGLSDVITFQGTSIDELEEAFRDSIDDYLEFCEERGKEPEKPYSGRLLLRLPPQLHRAIHMRARYEDKSLNRWITEVLQDTVYAELSSSQKERPSGPVSVEPTSGTGEPTSTFVNLPRQSLSYAEWQAAHLHSIAEYIAHKGVAPQHAMIDASDISAHVREMDLADYEGFLEGTKSFVEAAAKMEPLLLHVWETARKSETPHGPEGEE